VSSDLVGTSAGAVVDGRWTRRLSRDLFKVVAWYDNEFGYASQVLRAAQRTCGAAYE
jgi:glyceraldehyde 3-phosphate dehydrogenase